MKKLRRFWNKLFYTSPKSWQELQVWCKKACTLEQPDFFEDVCHGCKAFKDFVENEKKTGRWYKP